MCHGFPRTKACPSGHLTLHIQLFRLRSGRACEDWKRRETKAESVDWWLCGTAARQQQQGVVGCTIRQNHAADAAAALMNRLAVALIINYYYYYYYY